LFGQVHNWASLLFVAAVCLHLMRLFFTGAFRRPRWLNWGIWVTLLTLGMLAGFSCEILPDDMMSGGSLSNLEGVTLSVPVVGTHLMLWIFGGGFPGDAIIPRAYWLHVAVLPALRSAPPGSPFTAGCGPRRPAATTKSASRRTPRTRSCS